MQRGTIALIGSGELTSTMVEVHKSLLKPFGKRPNTVFLDTPAGFQPNCDQISSGALTYFQHRVQIPMELCSCKNSSVVDRGETQGVQKLRTADYILFGPGSPTYTVEQLRPTPIPTIMTERVAAGCCLAAASAAALTMGRFTLPVYEIYKAGHPLHWHQGLDVLGRFALECIVVPHWNNAEGGSHDTSRCFMGQARFDALLEILPEPLPILGIDEHTACIIHLDENSFEVRGLGTVVYQHGQSRSRFPSGSRHSLELLRGAPGAPEATVVDHGQPSADTGDEPTPAHFWESVRELDRRCRQANKDNDTLRAAGALLELDRLLWEGQEEQDPATLTESRDVFRELIVLLATRPCLGEEDLKTRLAPLVDELLRFRQQFRDQGSWQNGDDLRRLLEQNGILVEDLATTTTWRLAPRRPPGE